MSTESAPQYPNQCEQLLVFPLKESAIGDSIAWLSHFTGHPDVNLKIEERWLEKTDPALSSYMKSMGELRGYLQLSNEQLEQYKYGGMYAINLLKSQFEGTNLQMSHANESSLSTYFKSLISNPSQKPDRDVQYLTLVSVQPGMKKDSITPTVLTQMLKSNPKDNLLLRVKETFDNNSIEKLRQMWSGEINLSEANPAISNLIGAKQRGFDLGIMDVYWPFNMDIIIGPYVEIIDKIIKQEEF